ncbi:uncharacterized protein LOC114521239 [Dendronephthya gigantea]|uniref:uncharacterized protein LOC114521239 n=1 Tax=Dendronephthya gigantea TaxID=151771 RepID=UPI00106BDC6B|nr:uncharacterized protein LOC114521239 [Dendronephthya gigantea]
MKHCKNGGKTIIDLRDGPSSDPYRCECPKGFKGDTCEMSDLDSSLILSAEPTLRKKLIDWVGSSRKWTICWRATRDGWSASSFHTNCDHKTPTLIIIKVGRYIFGGYANSSWEGNGGCKRAPGSFIFSLRNKESLPPFISQLKQGRKGYAIHTSSSVGPVFGNGHDIWISNNAASNYDSHTNFNVGYQAPPGVKDTRTILAGSFNFSPSEIEVYYLL